MVRDGVLARESTAGSTRQRAEAPAPLQTPVRAFLLTFDPAAIDRKQEGKRGR